MGDDHDGDGGREKGRRRRSQHKKRLMRLSTRHSESTNEPTKLDQRYEGDIGVWLQRLQAGNVKYSRQKPEELKGDSEDNEPTCKRKNQDSLVDMYGEDTDYVLETLHRLKRWMKRMWRWGQCYTQYCYPSLRTVEYYRKVKAHQDRKKKCLERRANRNSKKPSDLGKKTDVARTSDTSPNDSSTGNTAKVDMDSKADQEYCPDDMTPNEVNYPIGDLDEELRPVKKLTLEPQSEDSLLSWTEYVAKQINDITRTMALYFSNDNEQLQITIFLKWMCYLFLPAVLILGVHYVFLKRKYKSLSGKLKKIKDENHVLTKESSKLESLLQNTEQLTMSMSTRESRAQAVADFTRLSESLMNSKKEMNQMKTEKAALLEELRMAKKRRDEAHKQYTSLKHENVQHEQYEQSIQT